uniref:(northern house mosquito) hypothetical protein n=1 Tax=Culex pipiens TaxID=7175 RepID=A0A8D8JMI5_CULPI
MAATNRRRLPLPVSFRDAPPAVLRGVVRPGPGTAAAAGHHPGPQLGGHERARHAPAGPTQAGDLARGHPQAGGIDHTGLWSLEGPAGDSVRERGGHRSGTDAGVLRSGLHRTTAL